MSGVVAVVTLDQSHVLGQEVGRVRPRREIVLGV